MNSDKFGDLLSNLDDLSKSQTFKVMLHLRELEPVDINVEQEVMASFNALNMEGVVSALRGMKNQFSKEDWETLLEII